MCVCNILSKSRICISGVIIHEYMPICLPKYRLNITLKVSLVLRFPEAPLLGKISRIRRAKSAHLRNASAKSRISDKRRLVQESDSSLTDVVEVVVESETKRTGLGTADTGHAA